MPWQEREKVELRTEFVREAAVEGVNFSELCRRYGITRPTGYLWCSRYEEAKSVKALEDRSKRPERSPSKIESRIERRICQLRCRYGWGARKLLVFLMKEKLDVSLSTVERVIKRNGLIDSRDSHPPALQRFQRAAPNELWQIDFKGPMGHDSCRCEPLSVLDDYSRFIVGLCVVRTKQTPEIQAAFLKVFKQHGLPDEILCDHGVPWWNNSGSRGLSQFAVWLMSQDIKLRFSGIAHPQTQGKVERFHRTLNDAVWHHGGGPRDTFSKWKRFLKGIVHEYNFVRPHESLQMKTPSEFYKRSSREFIPRPKPFEYEQLKPHSVLRVDWQGRVRYQGHKLFVSKALENNYVCVKELPHSWVVYYRNTLIREYDLVNRIDWAL